MTRAINGPIRDAVNPHRTVVEWLNFLLNPDSVESVIGHPSIVRPCDRQPLVAAVKFGAGRNAQTVVVGSVSELFCQHAVFTSPTDSFLTPAEEFHAGCRNRFPADCVGNEVKRSVFDSFSSDCCVSDPDYHPRFVAAFDLSSDEVRACF